MDTPPAAGTPDPSLELPAVAPLPEVSAHVVDGAGGGGEDAAPSAPVQPDRQPTVDASGARHDPTIHESPPRIAVRTGQWARLRGGSRKRAPLDARGSVAEPPEPTAATAATRPQTAPPTDHQAQGEMLAAMAFALARTVFGDDFAPEDGEHAALSQAFGNYSRAKNWGDVPPGAALAMVGIAIAAKRWNRPAVVAARAAWASRIRGWFGSAKAWLAHRYVDRAVGRDP